MLTPAFVSSPRTVPPSCSSNADEQVHGLDELMVAADGERLRVLQRLLELRGEFVHAHERSS